MHSAKDRLIAAAKLVGYGRSQEILQEMLVDTLCDAIRTVPIDVIGAVLDGRVTASELLKMTAKPRDPTIVEVEQIGEHHIARLPDGRTIRSKRRRDVARQVREAGLLIGP